MKKLLKKFNRLSRKKKIAVIVVLLALIGAGVAFALGVFDKVAEPEGPPPVYHSQLTGLEVSQEESEQPVLGIMVENSIFARPQTGIDAAGIVFESVTEGGITRYLAMYQEDMPTVVGPVRSVRPYFVNWIMGFDGSIAHVGGSGEALAMLESRNAKTLSQFKYPDEYYRVTDREAPHNMYTKTADLRKLQDKLGHKTAQFAEIPRSSDSPAQTPDATKIMINYSGPDYAVEFRYNKETNRYTRYLAGEPDIDRATNKPITVKNVIVIKMSRSTVDAIGSGEAIVFKDGTAVKGRWKQASYKERIKLTDAQGAEIPLNRGHSWFAVVPSVGSATY